MNITAYFANSGTPATGLSPIINIRDLSDNSLVITGEAMSEVGDGFYKYTFAGYNTAKDYTIRCDGGVALPAADRYSIATTGQEGEVSLIKTKIEPLVMTGGYVNAQVKAQDNIDFGAAQKVSLNAATPAVTVSDKTGFSLSSTGAEAIVAAVNELTTYGLTALNTLLVTTGIKTATTAAPADMALNSTVAKDATVSKPGTAQTITAPADMALNSTVAKETTLATVAGYIDTEIGTIVSGVSDIHTDVAAVKTVVDGIEIHVHTTIPGTISTMQGNVAGIPAAAAALVLATPANKLETDESGHVTYANTAPPTAIENADALLKRDWTELIGEAPRSVLNALRAIRNKWTIANTTLSVKKEDDSAEAWSSEVTVDEAGKPIIGSDPT